MAVIPVAEETGTGRGACCEKQTGLQTGPWRSSIFQGQEGGAHRADVERVAAGVGHALLLRREAVAVRCSREGQLHRNHWV